MQNKNIIVQGLLCVLFGPAGLLYYSTPVGVTGILLTLYTAMLLPTQVMSIWVTAVLLSCITGLILQYGRSKRDRIDNFQLADYVGNVSCKVIKQGANSRSHHNALRKLRFKKRAHKVVNATLGAMCLIASAFIVRPDLADYLQISQGGTEEIQTATVNNNNPQQVALTEKTDNGYRVKSTNFLSSGSNGQYRAQLDLSCINNKTALSLRSEDILGTQSSLVSMQFDDSGTTHEQWSIRDNYHRAYSPRPISTTKKILASDHLTLQFQPFGSDDKTIALFESSLFNSAVAAVRKQCHW